jgi:thioredoxin reductase
LSQLKGKRVAVIGNGQSALEYAALLHENGAQVEIIMRAAAIKFRPFAWRKNLFRAVMVGPLKSVSYKVFPPTDLGDIKTARKMADPRKFRSQAPEVQASLLKDCTKPVGAYWLPARLEAVHVRTSLTVKSAAGAGKGIRLELSDGTSDQFDQVVLATGYKIDINKYPILDNTLKKSIQQTPDGYPVLAATLQTSVEGLYMAGVIAERTLGPTLRFVTGTSNAGPQLAAGITGTPPIV